MKPAAALAIAAAAAAAAYFAGRSMAPAPAPGHSAPAPTAGGADPEELARARREAKEAAEARDAARAELGRLRGEVAAAESARAAERAAADAAGAAATAEKTAAASGAKERRIFWGGGEYEEALRKVDWKTVGTNMHAMVPLLRDLGAKLLAGESLPPETIGKIQQHNGPLVTAALQLGAAVPGTGPNGKFSDPGFMTNAIASTLESAGLPLTDEQAAALERTAKDFSARDEQRRNAYDAAAPALLKVLEEVELKDQFFDAAFALLRRDQADALTPTEVRHRIHGDIFSGALVWAGRAGVDTYADDGDLATKAVGFLKPRIKATEAQGPALRAAVEGWVATVPASVRGLAMDGLTKLNLVPNAHVNAWARQELELFKAVERGVALEDDQKERLRNIGGVAVLYQSATPADEGE